MPKLYRVNEIFHSVQAEGYNAGRSAVFVRFAGCNLSCPFCDTNHEPYTEMTASQIDEEIDRLDPARASMVVFTGGEPTLQLEPSEAIGGNRFKAVETNGIKDAPVWIGWVTVSPKTKLKDAKLFMASEVKFLWGMFPESYLESIEAAMHCSGYRTHLFIQPTAAPDGSFDVKPALDFVLRHPKWRLSLQWHKTFGVR